MNKWYFLALALMIAVFANGCGSQDTRLTVSGTVEAAEVNISAEVGGQIKDVQAEEGQHVKKGQLLAVLDDEVLRLKQRQAETRLETLAAQYRQLKSGSRSQQLTSSLAQVSQAAAGVDAARQAKALAETELNRIKVLYNQGAVAEQALNQAQLNYTQANSSYRAAVAKLESSEANLSLIREGADQEALNAMASQVEQAEIAVQQASLQLDKTKVRAVKDGVILSLNIREGEITRPGMPLVTLAGLDVLYIDTYLPEPWLAKVTLGQTVEISVDGYQQKLTGVLTHIAAEAEFTPNNLQTKEKRVDTVFAARVKVSQGEQVLKPGMPVDVYIAPRADQGGGKI